jgi:hypothetical protein
MTALGLLLLLTGAPSQDVRMAFPGGSVLIPGGCVGPSLSDAQPVAWLGTITCWPGPSIVVFADPRGTKACAQPGVAGGQRTQLVSAVGHTLEICASERTAAGRGTILREMVVGIGSTVLRAEIREPADAVMLLFIASTFE